MKKVVSVSLGSSTRDKEEHVTIGSMLMGVSRVGMDGSLMKAARTICSLASDPSVAAIGLGGVDLYVYAGRSRFTFKQVWLLKQAARGRIPVVDGSGLKHTLERQVIRYLAQQGLVDFHKCKVLMVCGVDRFGMSEELEAQGAQVLYGDLLFGLNVKRVFISWKEVEVFARRTLWFLTWLPIKWLYPTGKKQTLRSERGTEYFKGAGVIAGDWHFIRRYAPERLDGKVIITNTLRRGDIENLFQRGVHLIVTTTPTVCGESFATNVLEALLVAEAGRSLTPQGYTEAVQRLGFQPGIYRASHTRQ